MIFGMSSFFIRQHYTEAVTPFGDSEFIRTYLSIPWDMRVKGKLLRKWMVNKYPESGKYSNARNGLRARNEIKPLFSVAMVVNKQINKYYNRLFRGIKPLGMNDVDYWYTHNAIFRNYIDNYIKENKEYIKRYTSICELTDKLMTSNIVYDKLVVATVLSMFKNFIN